MKKLLLSMAVLAVASVSAQAADYEFYISTEEQNNEVVNFVLAEEGVTYTAHAHYIPDDFMIACEAYIKALNNTDSEVVCDITYTKEYDHSENLPAGTLFQTCFGGQCQDIVTATVPAHGATPGNTGEHLGYTAMVFSQEDADAVKFDIKYNITVTMGNFVRHFSILYSSNDASVFTLDTANTPAVYYNMQGMRVAEPAQGELYIVRQGEKVFKTIAK